MKGEFRLKHVIQEEARFNHVRFTDVEAKGCQVKSSS